MAELSSIVGELNDIERPSDPSWFSIPTVASLPLSKLAVPKITNGKEVAGETAAAESDFEIILRPHLNVGDGRYADSAWLQEVPDPVTKIVWDNAAVMNAGTAAKMGVVRGDVLSFETAASQGRNAVTYPVFVLPGMADGYAAGCPAGRPHGPRDRG